jgi:hypothetical protein
MKRPWRWRLRQKLNRVWEFVSRLPLGLWAALAVGLTMLELYLRGRRLDANLAQEKLQHVASEARANMARNAFREELHLERARIAQHRIEEIETARALAASSGSKEEKRLSTLDAKAVHVEYMKLLMKKWEKINVDPAFNIEPLGKITVRPRPPRKPIEPPK